MTTSADITTSLNAILTQIQNDTLTSSCPTGTFSDINLNSCPITYNGTYGDTTGYYVTYQLLLTGVLNAINLQITSQILSLTEESTYTNSITDNFTFSYVKPLTLSGSGSGTESVYIPGYSYSGCVLWGPSWSNSCFKTVFEKYCTTTISGWQCDESTEINVPSTSTTLETGNTDFSLQINGLNGEGTITYNLSYINPDISGNTLYPIYVTNEEYPKSIYYIYDIIVIGVTASFTSFTLSGVEFEITNQQILDILNALGGKFSQYTYDNYNTTTFQIFVNY